MQKTLKFRQEMVPGTKWEGYSKSAVTGEICKFDSHICIMSSRRSFKIQGNGQIREFVWPRPNEYRLDEDGYHIIDHGSLIVAFRLQS